MHVAGREVPLTTLIAVLAGLLGLIGTAFLGWEFGDGLDSPVAWVIGAAVALLAVYLSLTR